MEQLRNLARQWETADLNTRVLVRWVAVLVIADLTSFIYPPAFYIVTTAYGVVIASWAIELGYDNKKRIDKLIKDNNYWEDEDV